MEIYLFSIFSFHCFSFNLHFVLSLFLIQFAGTRSAFFLSLPELTHPDIVRAIATSPGELFFSLFSGQQHLVSQNLLANM